MSRGRFAIPNLLMIIVVCGSVLSAGAYISLATNHQEGQPTNVGQPCKIPGGGSDRELPEFPNANSSRLKTPGTTLQNVRLRAPVVIDVPGVRLDNVEVYGSGLNGIVTTGRGSVAMTNVTIAGRFSASALSLANIHAECILIRDFGGDGAKFGTNVSFDRSTIREPNPFENAHSDGIQIQDMVTDISITNSVIQMGTGSGRNSAIFMVPEFDREIAPGKGVLVSNNVLSGGGYTLYCAASSDGLKLKNVTIMGNKFETPVEHRSLYPVSCDAVIAGNSFPPGMSGEN